MFETGYAVDDGDVESVRRAVRQRVDSEYDLRRQTPFAWDFGATPALDDLGESVGSAGAQTLQMRDTSANPDQDNWGKQAGAVGMAIGKGEGASVKPMKTTANLWVLTTAIASSEVLEAMFARSVACLSRYGALKAQVAAAGTVAELTAIDPAAGWP